jgi:hypothetical protein
VSSLSQVKVGQDARLVASKSLQQLRGANQRKRSGKLASIKKNQSLKQVNQEFSGESRNFSIMGG